MDEWKREALAACSNPAVLRVAALYSGDEISVPSRSTETFEEFSGRAERLISRGFKGLVL